MRVNFSGQIVPKKVKVGLSANKVMVTVFWDARGLNRLPLKGKNKHWRIYYLLDRFNNDKKVKRPHLVNEKVLLHQDNACEGENEGIGDGEI